MPFFGSLFPAEAAEIFWNYFFARMSTLEPGAKGARGALGKFETMTGFLLLKPDLYVALPRSVWPRVLRFHDPNWCFCFSHPLLRLHPFQQPVPLMKK
jgi:hypothetical protein